MTAGRADEGRASAWSRFSRRWNEVAGVRPRLRKPKAYLNWVRANTEYLLRTGTVRARPLKLTFDPTNHCQLRCPLCPTGARIHDRDRGVAQLDVFKDLMDEVGDYVFAIDFFNWGEPLLNDRIEDFVWCASRRGIVTIMSSNLSLPLSDARLRQLVLSGLSQLTVSLDGATAATYGKYRRLGRFDLVISNLERLLAIRKELGAHTPYVNWQFLVFRYNEQEIDAARRLAAELRVDSLTFRAPFLDEGRVPLAEGDRTEIASWTPTLPAFNRYAGAASDVVVPARPRCGWHYMSSAINWDGSVAPCCTVFEKRDDFGRVSDGSSYMSIINNRSFRAVRNSFAGREGATGLVCDRCPTPFLMSYGTHLNKQIALYTLVSLADALLHPFERFKRARASGRASDSPAPVLHDSARRSAVPLEGGRS